MATSNNLGLYLPVREDYISVKRDLSDNYELLDAAAGNLDIIINGNTASQNVTTGQFVTVLNSTITGVTDGLYKALTNVSAGNSFVAANLQAVSSGALNDLTSQLGNLSDQIASKRVTQIGNYTVSTTVTAVNLSESIANFDLLIVGEIQTYGSTKGRYSFPPVIITPEFCRLSDSAYVNMIATGVYFYYVSDTQIMARGDFSGAIFRVYGVKL